MLVDCDIWTVVDFGKGDVEIKCTQIGPHDQHICQVVIIVDEETTEPTRQNIFEQRAS